MLDLLNKPLSHLRRQLFDSPIFEPAVHRLDLEVYGLVADAAFAMDC
jgi:hypothetical protein